jgi:hypothetical protein
MVEMRYSRAAVWHGMTFHGTIKIIIRNRRMVGINRVTPTVKMHRRVAVTDILDILL